MPDDSRASWRPQDENGTRHRRMRDDGREREYGDDERYASRERERMGSPWDDRSGRSDDRHGLQRSTEWHGQGQSGYGAGRDERDRSYGSRNELYPREADHPERGVDDRFTGRGGYSYREDRPGGHSGGHRGKGPAGYTRSDERIRELVCEALTDDDHIDATNIDVAVRDGEVTLSGTVDDRQQKRLAHDLVDNMSGVKDVVNQLRIARSAGAR